MFGIFCVTPVFPTRVGMNRNAMTERLMPFGIPHTRGDEPLTALLEQVRQQYSPHAWG